MKNIFDLFRPPVIPKEEESTRTAYYLNALVLISFGLLALLLAVRPFLGENTSVPSTTTLIAFIVMLAIVYAALRSGDVSTASHLLLIMLWIASTVQAFYRNGAEDTSVVGYFAVIALAGLLVGYRTALIMTGISVLGIFGLSAAEIYGAIQPQPMGTFAVSVQISAAIILTSVFTYLNLSNSENATKQIRKRVQDSEKSNRALRELQRSLEKRIDERNTALTKANLENKRRTAQFQTITQVAQSIAAERNLEALLTTIVETISVQFDYYHVAIYLNDDVQEYTILSAASSKGGKRMIENGHKLIIGQTGIVGYVAKTGNYRLATDISADEVYFKGAELNETRSEIALPLKVGSQMIGVLDVQSNKVNAFDQADIDVLFTLAGQTTIAVQNTRLFAETQTALAESQLLYGTVVQQTWRANLQTSPQVGYRYAGVKPVPLTKEISTPEIRSAMENGDVAVTHPSRRKNENALAVPLKLRDATIGVININLPVDMEPGEDEIEIVRAAAQRIAIALESASLLEESQRRARREQTISAMSAKISAETEIATILKVTAKELGFLIGGAQISVEIGSENE